MRSFPEGPFAYQNSSGCETMGVAALEQENMDVSSASLLSLRKYGENTPPIYIKGDEEAGIKNTVSKATKENSLFDITGRRLLSPPTRGIYIRNGRKIVIE